MSEKILMNWSGGKDSAFALYLLLRDQKVEVESLFTSINAQNKRISMHGVHLNLLKKQADAIGLPLHLLALPERPSMEEYNALMIKNLKTFSQRGITTAAFGDILLEDLKTYRDKQLATVHWKTLYPLWQKNTAELVLDFLKLGFKTRICCIDAHKIPSEFLGEDLDEHLIKALPKGVDPCGENGEFHTFVHDGPIFSSPLKIKNGNKIMQTYQHDGKDYRFEFIDLLLA